jgi:hypothetical protein
MGPFGYFLAKAKKNAASNLLADGFGRYAEIEFGSEIFTPDSFSKLLIARAWNGSHALLLGKTPLLKGVKPHILSIVITALVDPLKAQHQERNLLTIGLLISALGSFLKRAIELNRNHALNQLDQGLVEEGAKAYLILSGHPYEASQAFLPQLELMFQAA